MEAGSIYLWLALSPLHEHLQPQRWVEASLPIRIGRSDLTNIEAFARASRRPKDVPSVCA
jgi:hypothetical protein